VAKRGRRTKLNEQIKSRFLQAINIGATYEDACQYAGVSFQTLMNWQKRREPEFVEFFESVELAEGVASITWLAILEKHASIDPKWAAWKLERRHPDRWGSRQRNTNVNVNLDVTELSNEQLEQVIRGEDVDFSTVASASRTRTQAAT
jgi:transposase